MPVIINEIVITTNIEKNGRVDNPTPSAQATSIDDMVKQVVEKVLEILDEKKQR